jgi:DNA-binding protein YbaB
VRDTAPLMALLASEERRMRDESFPFSDETGTVTVEMNGYLWLTGLDIVDGTLRLGARVVQDRVNDALRRAANSVPAFLDAHFATVEARIVDMIGELPGAQGQSVQTRSDSREADGDSNW